MNTTHELIFDFLLFIVDIRPDTIVVWPAPYAHKNQKFHFLPVIRHPRGKIGEIDLQSTSEKRGDLSKNVLFFKIEYSICRYRFPNIFIGRVLLTKPKSRCSFIVLRFIDLRETELSGSDFVSRRRPRAKRYGGLVSHYTPTGVVLHQKSRFPISVSPIASHSDYTTTQRL